MYANANLAGDKRKSLIIGVTFSAGAKSAGAQRSRRCRQSSPAPCQGGRRSPGHDMQGLSRKGSTHVTKKFLLIARWLDRRVRAGCCPDLVCRRGPAGARRGPKRPASPSLALAQARKKVRAGDLTVPELIRRCRNRKPALRLDWVHVSLPPRTLAEMISDGGADRIPRYGDEIVSRTRS
jgi:hypothetical protein